MVGLVNGAEAANEKTQRGNDEFAESERQDTRVTVFGVFV